MNKSLCFTGHRPQKLVYGFNEHHEMCIRLKDRLRFEIRQKIEEGIDTFLCGMALGTDIWCGEIVVELQKEHRGIHLIACIPHNGQEKKWNDDYQRRYRALLNCAEDQVVISDHYTKDCMQIRNEYMVDHSSHMIAVYNGQEGGTKTTIEYAIKKGRNIILLDPTRMVRRSIMGMPKSE